MKKSDLRKMIKEELLKEESYKASYGGTTIEITGLDRSFARIMAPNLIGTIKHELELNKTVNVKKISIECD